MTTTKHERKGPIIGWINYFTVHRVLFYVYIEKNYVPNLVPRHPLLFPFLSYLWIRILYGKKAIREIYAMGDSMGRTVKKR